MEYQAKNIVSVQMEELPECSLKENVIRANAKRYASLNHAVNVLRYDWKIES